MVYWIRFKVKFKLKEWCKRNDYKQSNCEERLSESVSSDSLGQLKISGHDGDSLGVNGTQVGVFEQRDEVGFSSFLEGKDGWGLESEFLFEFVGNFSNHSLEG